MATIHRIRINMPKDSFSNISHFTIESERMAGSNEDVIFQIYLKDEKSQMVKMDLPREIIMDLKAAFEYFI